MRRFDSDPRLHHFNHLEQQRKNGCGLSSQMLLFRLDHARSALRSHDLAAIRSRALCDG
jgi:hypothetical protein